MDNIYSVNNFEDILAKAKHKTEFDKLKRENPGLLATYIYTIHTGDKLIDLSMRHHLIDIIMSMYDMLSLEEIATISELYSNFVSSILEILNNHGISTEEDFKREYEKLKEGT